MRDTTIIVIEDRIIRTSVAVAAAVVMQATEVAEPIMSSKSDERARACRSFLLKVK